MNLSLTPETTFVIDLHTFRKIPIIDIILLMNTVGLLVLYSFFEDLFGRNVGETRTNDNLLKSQIGEKYRALSRVL